MKKQWWEEHENNKREEHENNKNVIRIIYDCYHYECILFSKLF